MDGKLRIWYIFRIVRKASEFRVLRTGSESAAQIMHKYRILTYIICMEVLNLKIANLNRCRQILNNNIFNKNYFSKMEFYFIAFL